MNFKNFKKALQENFAKMTEEAACLFEVDVDKDEMWNLYLDSFPAGLTKFTENAENMIAAAADNLSEILVMQLLSKIIKFIQYGILSLMIRLTSRLQISLQNISDHMRFVMYMYLMIKRLELIRIMNKWNQEK